MITDRGNTICLLEILKEFSDSEHILTMKEILLKMNLVYGINPDRRTVYSSIALLNDMGYDISDYEDNGKGYYLRSRDFEQSEVMLLADAVYSFPFILLQN
jgi:predicted DNA-binding transcriptional regulator YafY